MNGWKLFKTFSMIERVGQCAILRPIRPTQSIVDLAGLSLAL